MAYQNSEFLQNFIASRLDPSLIAGVQRIPRSNYPAGRGPNRIPAIDDYGSGAGSYNGWGGGRYQQLDDEYPNPFGGGGAPYMPGASLPYGQNQIAAVLGEPGRKPGTANNPYRVGPATDLPSAQYGARKALERDLQLYPNPFGGGGVMGTPYVPGV